MPTHDAVLVERLDQVAIVRLHRPAVMNAVNAELRAALKEQLYALDADANRSSYRANRQRRARLLRRPGS